MQKDILQTYVIGHHVVIVYISINCSYTMELVTWSHFSNKSKFSDTSGQQFYDKVRGRFHMGVY